MFRRKFTAGHNGFILVCVCQHDGEKEVETSSQNMDLGFPEEDEHHHDG